MASTSRSIGGNHQAVGASSRQEMFSSRSKGTEDLKTTPRSQEIRRLNQDPTASGPIPGGEFEHERAEPTEADAMELEHVVGYSGFRGTLLAHPKSSDNFYKSVGSALILSDVLDPHNQKQMWGHDMDVSAMAVSSSGAFVASGQKGSTKVKGYPAPVILWSGDLENPELLMVLEGITGGVSMLNFSPDDALLAAAGEDGTMYIWDVGTGEVLYGRQYKKPVDLFVWGYIDAAGRRPVYEICMTAGTSEMKRMEFSFDPARRQWELDGEGMLMPSSGGLRAYTSGVILPGRGYLLCGTEVGDMVVFRLSSRVYRASVPVSAGGLAGILVDPNSGNVVVGGGDGKISCLSGSDMQWSREAEVQLDGSVVSMSLSADGLEVIAGTACGSVYRVALASLKEQQVSWGHSAPVTCIATGPRADVFATASRDGKVRVWDLGDYGVLSIARGASVQANPTCLSWLLDKAIVSGWDDRSIRCTDAGTGAELWVIPEAHREAVSCLAVQSRSDSGAAYLVSGGDDGGLRVWSLKGRQLLLQFVEHHKRVTSVVVDTIEPHVFHSCGMDCNLYSYDIKQEKRTVCHMTRSGGFTSISQRIDSEQEIVTANAVGKLLFWDCDVPDPVEIVDCGAPQRIRHCAASPSRSFLAVCGDDSLVKVLELDGSQHDLVTYGKGHSGSVTSVAWSADEKQIVSASDDGSICIWNWYK